MDATVPLAILGIYGVVALLERIPALRFKPSRLLRPFFATDVGWYAATVGVTVLFGPVFEGASQLRALLGIPGFEALALPLPLLVFSALVLYDLGQFLGHVLLHRFELLWRIHKVHHSSRTLDWLATTRGHTAEHLFRSLPTQAVLYALGLPFEAIAIAIVIYVVFAALGHSNLRLNLALLEPLFITPRLHRLHHVLETTEKNLGTVFSFWDRLAGRLAVHSAGPDDTLGVPGEEQTYPQSWWPQLLEPFRIRAKAESGFHRLRPAADLPAANRGDGGA